MSLISPLIAPRMFRAFKRIPAREEPIKIEISRSYDVARLQIGMLASGRYGDHIEQRRIDFDDAQFSQDDQCAMAFVLARIVAKALGAEIQDSA